ncbi:TIGR00725 family protein [candidate division WOR-3 bacterium]|nr:TIGR00725 family protein [candidate division WOR-3 bacterium]
MKKPFIGVSGGSRADKEIAEIAFQVGREIAMKGAILVCGGLGGVMNYSAKGAKEEGGMTIGILPGGSRDSANPYIDIPIVTDMETARNVILVKTSECIIAIDGRYGTLSEIAIALSLNIPVIGLKTWEIDERITRAENAKQAVELALQAIG